MIDTIFERPLIYDGSGRPPFRTDVGVVGGRIALIADLRGREAFRRIDGRSFSLAPGFIDAHSHSDELWLANPYCDGKIRQGVTTEIGGNCGSSAAPLGGLALERKVEVSKPYGVAVDWRSLDEFFSLIQSNGVALNVASLVGLGTTRLQIAGEDDRRLDGGDLKRQQELVRAAIEQGALGVSSGLAYVPSRYADSNEQASMAAAAREAGGALYAVHLRDEGPGLLDAVGEALSVGRSAEVAIQLSHHKAAGRRNWGKVHQSLAMADEARARGCSVHVDAYPYVASWTELATILPDDVRKGGREATLGRIADPAGAVAAGLKLELERGGTWHEIMITDVGSERNAHLVGQRLDAIARAWKLSPPQAALRLLREERLAVDAAFFNMSEDDVATVLSASFCCIGSDASARAITGVTARGMPHPRAFGTFPRVFGRFVRTRPTLTTQEAVRRMTSLPARIFGIHQRGMIESGFHADLVLFNEATIVDTATYEQPYAYPDGIESVFVNGVAVVEGGKTTRALPGRVLRSGR